MYCKTEVELQALDVFISPAMENTLCAARLVPGKAIIIHNVVPPHVCQIERDSEQSYFLGLIRVG